MSKPWFSVEAKAQTNSVDIWLMSAIGNGYWGEENTAQALVTEVDALGDLAEIRLHINSPGGDVFAGVAIYNYLQRHTAKIVVIVEGQAASVASIIACAGDEIRMPKNTSMFIHDPYTCICGDVDDIAPDLERLHKITEQMADIYASRSKMTAGQARELMQGDTTLTADECLDRGLCDQVLEPLAIAASADGVAYALTAQLRAKQSEIAALKKQQAEQVASQQAQVADQQPADLGALVAICTERGLLAQINAIAAQKLPLPQARALVEQLGRVGKQCDAAGISANQVIGDWIADPAKALGVAMAEVKAQDADIDSSTPVDSSRLDVQTIYQRRKPVEG